MGISDWSSDVCSSDLEGDGRRLEQFADADCANHGDHHQQVHVRAQASGREPGLGEHEAYAKADGESVGGSLGPGHGPAVVAGEKAQGLGKAAGEPRSEEHTSELQSLMRISYAVFCLKKKQYSEQNQAYNDTAHRSD